MRVDEAGRESTVNESVRQSVSQSVVTNSRRKWRIRLTKGRATIVVEKEAGKNRGLKLATIVVQLKNVDCLGATVVVTMTFGSAFLSAWQPQRGRQKSAGGESRARVGRK